MTSTWQRAVSRIVCRLVSETPNIGSSTMCMWAWRMVSVSSLSMMASRYQLMERWMVTSSLERASCGSTLRTSASVRPCREAVSSSVTAWSASRPPGRKILMPLYRAGLWEAVTAIPYAAPRRRTVHMVVGVGEGRSMRVTRMLLPTSTSMAHQAAVSDRKRRS